ncbi:hypothetical protein F511_23327 [Dorcoceras hygrometricum]|uniref:Uncharacterized protein n=1 Tax=Dorcoceras hygrometricum TaxID=472368 RepID=A0A2Z7AI22_9LAMI|nr:hypothetical protein F511_23327 [Dorcoceras hygrometricum]
MKSQSSQLHCSAYVDQLRSRTLFSASRTYISLEYLTRHALFRSACDILFSFLYSNQTTKLSDQLTHPGRMVHEYEEGACLTVGVLSFSLEISLTSYPIVAMIPNRDSNSLRSDITFTVHLTNQIKRRNISSLMYENLLGGHSSQYSRPYRSDQIVDRSYDEVTVIGMNRMFIRWTGPAPVGRRPLPLHNTSRPPPLRRRAVPPAAACRDRTCFDHLVEELPSMVNSSALLVQTDEGAVHPVVDLIRRSTAAYLFKCRFPCETGRSQEPRRQQGNDSNILCMDYRIVLMY